MRWTTPAGRVYNFHVDLLNQKHLMIAGASGSGKSVLLNGIIYNALYRAPGDAPGCVSFILIDPKRVELMQYRQLPHTIRYASEPDEMVDALRAAMDITESRYKVMQSQGVRLYNGGDIYVLIDEFADLMTTCKKQVVPLVQRLAQIGRAARVHIILCTQCPLAKIIPTEIKVNFDSIVGLHTASAQHSRNIIGVAGCELLPKFGECYYQKPGADLVHYSGIPYFSDNVIIERVHWWLSQTPQTRPKKTGFFRKIFKTA